MAVYLQNIFGSIVRFDKPLSSPFEEFTLSDARHVVIDQISRLTLRVKRDNAPQFIIINCTLLSNKGKVSSNVTSTWGDLIINVYIIG
ncbi:hypothetical protein CWM47_36905 [Spirosoma pollinicola]|uniref:Uncharacterized protein n=1 Tax=Spirosoma pollinicola TaxID=2057025 RepID=A0A2K8ZAQ7_9BACT|nr:hypothetical protein CWM47_36905 [Spirosoma pollinicola]